MQLLLFLLGIKCVFTIPGDSRVLEVVMYMLLIVIWLISPFMSWVFVIPATIISRYIFVNLLGEDVSLHLCLLK